MSSKAAIITDTHWGIRNDNLSFLNHNKRFLEEVFFPEIEKYPFLLFQPFLSINYIIHTNNNYKFLKPCR